MNFKRSYTFPKRENRLLAKNQRWNISDFQQLPESEKTIMSSKFWRKMSANLEFSPQQNCPLRLSAELQFSDIKGLKFFFPFTLLLRSYWKRCSTKTKVYANRKAWDWRRWTPERKTSRGGMESKDSVFRLKGGTENIKRLLKNVIRGRDGIKNFWVVVC